MSYKKAEARLLTVPRLTLENFTIFKLDNQSTDYAAPFPARMSSNACLAYAYSASVS